MESYIPKNSINTPLKEGRIEYYKQENIRLRDKIVNLKLQLIEEKKNIFTSFPLCDLRYKIYSSSFPSSKPLTAIAW